MSTTDKTAPQAPPDSEISKRMRELLAFFDDRLKPAPPDQREEVIGELLSFVAQMSPTVFNLSQRHFAEFEEIRALYEQVDIAETRKLTIALWPNGRMAREAERVQRATSAHVAEREAESAAVSAAVDVGANTFTACECRRCGAGMHMPDAIRRLRGPICNLCRGDEILQATGVTP